MLHVLSIYFINVWIPGLQYLQRKRFLGRRQTRFLNQHRVWLLKCCKNKNSYDVKIYFHSIKITLYLKKIYFHYIKTNLYSIKCIFIKSTFMIYKCIFIQVSKIYFYHTNISLSTFLVSISGLPFVLTKVVILLSVCKLKNRTRM